jgi:hemolysin activation/secretion protein
LIGKSTRRVAAIEAEQSKAEMARKAAVERAEAAEREARAARKRQESAAAEAARLERQRQDAEEKKRKLELAEQREREREAEVARKAELAKQEAERRAAEKVEAARKKAEAEEAERLAKIEARKKRDAEKAEAARLKAEAEEGERLAKIEARKKREAEKAEAARKKAKAEEAERLAEIEARKKRDAEKAEAARKEAEAELAAKKKRDAEKAEAAREKAEAELAAKQKHEAEKAEAEKAEREAELAAKRKRDAEKAEKAAKAKREAELAEQREREEKARREAELAEKRKRQREERLQPAMTVAEGALSEAELRRRAKAEREAAREAARRQQKTREQAAREAKQQAEAARRDAERQKKIRERQEAAERKRIEDERREAAKLAEKKRKAEEDAKEEAEKQRIAAEREKQRQAEKAEEQRQEELAAKQREEEREQARKEKEEMQRLKETAHKEFLERKREEKLAAEKERGVKRQEDRRKRIKNATDRELQKMAAAGDEDAKREHERRIAAAKAEYERLQEERAAQETEMERKARRDLAAAQKELNVAQLEQNRAETELMNIQRAIRELSQKEQEAKLLYVEKTRAATLAQGQQAWNAALIEVRAAEENADAIMLELKDYRYQEQKAKITAEQSRRQSELANMRFREAQKTYALYEREAKKRRVSDALGTAAIEEVHAKLERGKPIAGRATGPEEISYEGAWPPEAVEEKTSARAARQQGNKYDINAVVITGDREPVYALPNWSDYENDALYAPMSDADIENFRQRLLKDLQDNGYVFATVSVYKHSLGLGFLKFRVHVGQMGEVTVVGNTWYTAEQILRSIDWTTHRRFNYRDLYSNLFEFNAKPDINADVKLLPRVDEQGRRIIDVDITTEGGFPGHLTFTLDNNGSKETSDLRLRTTFQQLNLTQKNDILTLEYLTDPGETGAVDALSVSYYLPQGKGRGLTVFGGISQSDIDDVNNEFDISGKGWYLGAQLSRVLKDTKDYTLDLTLGWLLQQSENQTDFNGLTFQEQDITLSMPSMTVGYSAKNFDEYGGRNFLSNTIQVNFAGKFGSSSHQNFTQVEKDAEGDFVMDRFHFARFQKLFAGESEPGKWSAFLRLDGQFADNALVPSLQKGIGGPDSVRGYRTREVQGDSGYSGTVEVRTPLVSNFIPGLIRGEEYRRANPEDWMMHRLQFNLFYDFGRIDNADPKPGESSDSQSFSSYGAGFRLGLTKY